MKNSNRVLRVLENILVSVSKERGEILGSEKNFENKVKKFLEDEGCWFLKYWGGAAYTKSGIPDILCCCKGFFVGVEIKAQNGRPSPLQIHNLKKINEAGGCAVLLYPDQFEKFKTMIKWLGCGWIGRQYYDELKQVWVDWDVKFSKGGDAD